MKKRIIVLLVLIATMATLLIATSCKGGCNKELFDLQYAYNRAYIKVGEEWVDISIKSWTDYEGEQLQITLHDGSKILVSSISCILYYGELPTS